MTESSYRSYLLVVDGSTLKLDDAMAKIDEDDAIVNWHKILPEAAVLVSRLPIAAVHDKLRRLFPDHRYLLVRVDGAAKNGWLPKNAWTSMNSPSSVFDK